MPRNDPRVTTVKMTATQPGSPDGKVTKTYEEGRVYTIPTELAKVFLEQEWAVKSKGDGSDDSDVDAGEGTGLLELPEGMVTRNQLAKDELNNKELHDYAVNNCGAEAGFLALNTKHKDMLKEVIAIQLAWEKAELERQAEED